MIQTRTAHWVEKKIVIIITIIGVLVIYFFFALYFFPGFYLSHLSESYARPFISKVSFPLAEVILGKAFQVSVIAVNEGDNADLQLVSISFPNLTNTNEVVSVLSHNFTQSPLLVQQGEEIGSGYRGLADTIPAKFPSIQFYSRPWKSGTSYSAQLEITPASPGKFTMLTKTVTLPHINDSSHYPRSGLKDFQQEYVSAYSANVVKP